MSVRAGFRVPATVATLLLTTMVVLAAGDPPPPDPGTGGGAKDNGGTAHSACTETTCTVKVSDPGANSAPGGGGASASDPCTYTAVVDQAGVSDAWTSGAGGPSVNPSSGLPHELPLNGPPAGVDPATGVWILRQCPVGGNSLYWVPPGGAPRPTPQSLAQQALATLHLQPVPLDTAPRDKTVVKPNDTWLWVDGAAWKPVSATATAGGVSATVTARPLAVTYTMGDTHTVTCSGPSTPYDISIPYEQQHTDCAYLYPKSSANAPGQRFTVTAVVSWSVTWTSTIGVNGSLGTITGPPSNTTLEVDEIHAVNI